MGQAYRQAIRESARSMSIEKLPALVAEVRAAGVHDDEFEKITAERSSEQPEQPAEHAEQSEQPAARRGSKR